LTYIVRQLENWLQRFDSDYSHQREQLLDMACERFRIRLETFNNAPNQNFYIEAFTVGYGNLIINKNAYFAVQEVCKKLEAQNQISILEEIYAFIDRAEHQSFLSFRDKWLPQELDNIGATEIRARIAITGKCRFKMSLENMSGWMNTHTLFFLNIMAQMLGDVTDADRNSIIEDLFYPFIDRYYSQRSVII